LREKDIIGEIDELLAEDNFDFSPLLVAARNGVLGTGTTTRDGRFVVQALDSAQSDALLALVDAGYVKHCLEGSFLARVYAHFSLHEKGGAHFILTPATQPRASAFAPRYSGVVELDGRGTRALVLDGVVLEDLHNKKLDPKVTTEAFLRHASSAKLRDCDEATLGFVRRRVEKDVEWLLSAASKVSPRGANGKTQAQRVAPTGYSVVLGVRLEQSPPQPQPVSASLGDKRGGGGGGGKEKSLASSAASSSSSPASEGHGGNLPVEGRTKDGSTAVFVEVVVEGFWRKTQAKGAGWGSVKASAYGKAVVQRTHALLQSATTASTASSSKGGSSGSNNAVTSKAKQLAADLKRSSAAAAEEAIKAAANNGEGLQRGCEHAVTLLSEKEYDGSESASELVADAAALVKDDFPCRAVSVLRRARQKAQAEAEALAAQSDTAEAKGKSGGGARRVTFKGEQQQQGDPSTGSGSRSSSSSVVDSDPLAAGAVACEAELVALLEDIADDSLWQKHGTSKACTVYVERDQPDDARKNETKPLRFRTEMDLDCDIFCATAAMFEVEDFVMWLPGADQSTRNAALSLFRFILRTSGWKPWPIGRDEIFLQAYGDTCDAKEILGPASPLGTGIAIYFCPASEEEWPRTLNCRPIDATGGYWFETVKRKVKVKVKGKGGIEEEIEEEIEVTRAVLVATLDLHMAIPQVVLNFLLVNVAYMILPMLLKHAQKYAVGGKLRDRIDSKPKVYGEIQRRLDVSDGLAERRRKISKAGDGTHAGFGEHDTQLLGLPKAQQGSLHSSANKRGTRVEQKEAKGAAAAAAAPSSANSSSVARLQGRSQGGSTSKGKGAVAGGALEGGWLLALCLGLVFLVFSPLALFAPPSLLNFGFSGYELGVAGVFGAALAVLAYSVVAHSAHIETMVVVFLSSLLIALYAHFALNQLTGTSTAGLLM